MLKKIYLRNFKCFAEIELELGGLNIFTGINSMGKSTVLQSLLLLRQALENDALGKGIYLNGEYASVGTGRDLLYSNAENEVIEIHLSGDEGEFIGKYGYQASADYLKNTGQASVRGELNLFKRGFSYISAERLGPQLSYDKSYYEVHERRRMGNHGEYAVHFLYDNQEEKIENKSVLHPDEDNPFLLRQTEKWMSEISPGIRIDFEDYGRANKMSMRVRQMNNDECTADYFSVRNIGFGLTCVLPVVLSLLAAKQGDLLIVENPEAHLHPKGQRKMGELIARVANGGVQVILETHSDHLLNGVRLSVRKNEIGQDKVKVYFFKNNQENGKKEIVNPLILSDGRISSWPDGFFDEWDKAIDELF